MKTIRISAIPRHLGNVARRYKQLTIGMLNGRLIGSPGRPPPTCTSPRSNTLSRTAITIAFIASAFTISPFLFQEACSAEPSTTMKNNAITITIGSTTFNAILANNSAARELLARLPLTLFMEDMNRNEKFIRIPKPLPTASPARSGTAHAGELMLWGDDGIVFFYKTFSTLYSYTPLARIEHNAQLETSLQKALGNGKITVTIQQVATPTNN